jgi:ABC-type cobalamin/Fe3+-siderophores transport system ATPase subunit
MSQMTEITLENYRSFRSARCRLSPFTLIVGANNAGKSNLLKAVRDVALGSSPTDSVEVLGAARHHASDKNARTEIVVTWSDGRKDSAWTQPDEERSMRMFDFGGPKTPIDGMRLEIYRFDPNLVGAGEGGSGEPYIAPNGAGVSWMLDKWNSGARTMRMRFEQVVNALRRCVPEIEALSFYDEDVGRRAIQVEQTNLPEPRPLTEVSDGTRLVLAILTLVNQETPPPVLLLEDIDRGLHPRLYEKLVAFLRSLAAQGHTQILATTHDPYLIDEFRDAPEAVVIVDKNDGASTLSNLDDRLKAILDPDEELDMPLGQVWYSGMVGGVPKMKLPEILDSKRE